MIVVVDGDNDGGTWLVIMDDDGYSEDDDGW